MKNVNRFLQSARRSDLCGYNIASLGRQDLEKISMYPDQRPGGAFPEAQWDPPRPGMHGVFVLGHHTDVVDALRVEYTLDGVPQERLNVTRNQWTPAWMDTIYRSQIHPEYYPHSGTLVIRERKAITRADLYIAHVRLLNEKRDSASIQIRFQLPFKKEGALYRVDTHTLPGALLKNYPIQGYMALAVSLGPDDTFSAVLAPSAALSFRYALAFGLSRAEARRKAEAALKEEAPFQKNEEEFNAWFARYVPQLEMENMDLLKVYYYRWFVVYHSIHKPIQIIPEHPIPRPCIYESLLGGWYGAPVGLPVPWQIEEAKWMRRDDYMRAHLENWTENRGIYQSYIQFVPWAAWHAYELHPDKAWLRRHYDSFKRYIAEKIDLIHPQPTITRGSWGTGAEYQPSFYQYTPGEPWDWRYDVEGNQAEGLPLQALYRLDELCYHVLSLRGCAKMAAELGEREDERIFLRAAGLIASVVLKEHWDEKQRFFFDRDTASGRRCDQAASYDGFAPFMDGIAGREYHAAFRWLEDPGWFAADFGIPTAARNCPMFWYDNCIAGPTQSSVQQPHDYGCSWNGPVWPYANSIVAMGLGAAARQAPSLKEQWLRFFAAWTELHFPGGDRSTPLVCEHYRCDDGATFSIANDYFHSSWLNPFLTFFLGIQVENGSVSFDPFTQEDFCISGVVIGDRDYTFTQYHENGSRRLKMTGKKFHA